MSMPGTVVWIGRNGPRYSVGASGLGSKVSNWLGPPHIQNRMTAVWGSDRSAAARAASTSARLMPPRARTPARRNSRRDTGPGQETLIMTPLQHVQPWRQGSILTEVPADYKRRTPSANET